MHSAVQKIPFLHNENLILATANKTSGLTSKDKKSSANAKGTRDSDACVKARCEQNL